MARHFINGDVAVSDYEIARDEWNAIDDHPEPPEYYDELNFDDQDRPWHWADEEEE